MTTPTFERTPRNSDDMLGELRWNKIPVLDDGFVCLVDAMGTDASIVQAARVSYGKDDREFRKLAEEMFPEGGSSQYCDPAAKEHGPGDGLSLAERESVEIEQHKRDRTLIRYLFRHRHTTPVEMCELKFLVRVPMDTWRQWIRHRTACLTGDTELVFDLPNGKPYRISVAGVFERFQPTANQSAKHQKNPYFKKDRVQSMRLRSINEETGEVRYTSIVDVWQTGVKPVFRVRINTKQHERIVRVSKDHLFHTPDGWKKLEDLRAGDEVTTISSRMGGLPTPSFNEIDPETEVWAGIVGWESYYEISTQGRVRRIAGGKGSRSRGRCKKITVSQNRAVVSLNRPREQVVILVHREMLRAFAGEPESVELEACHKNGNSLDNELENLYWGTSKQNSEDMIAHGRETSLCSQPCTILSIVPDGEEMTYDLEVEGPWHNFSANDFVVHNSVNEYSTRYTEAIDSQQKTDPAEWRLQSGSNKQGSSGFLPRHVDGSVVNDSGKAIGGGRLTKRESDFHEIARQLYEERLEAGVAREQARKDLPLSTYTEAYWKINLHNLLHFLGLRMHSHAQKEIRDYANAIGEIVSILFPMAWEAFQEYHPHMGGMSLSATEVAALGMMLNGVVPDFEDVFENKRERSEFEIKLKRMSPNET